MNRDEHALNRDRFPLTELSLLILAIAITGWTLALALAYPAVWARVGREDGFVEILGAMALLALSLVAAMRLKESPPGVRAPSVVAVFVGLVGAGEEISWGQRLFNIEPPSFFSTHNVQGEINLHNLIHPPWDVVLAAVLILGFCVSPVWRDSKWARRLVNYGLPWPRPIHTAVLAVCLAAVLVVGLITGVGDLEEVGELLVVLVVAATWCRNGS